MTLHSFAVAFTAAFLVAGVLGVAQARRIGLDGAVAWDLVPFAFVGGLVGAKLLSVAIHPGAFVAEPALFFSARSGLVWYGGLAGGLAAVLWRGRSWGLPPLLLLAGAAAPVALGHAIGRLGCFLVGDDYGRPTAAWFGVAFPDGAPPTTAVNLRAAGAVVPPELSDAAVLAVHPTQLYEMAALLGIAVATGRMWRRGVSPARICAVYAAAYGAFRFLVEILRVKDDHLPIGLTLSQVLSLILLGAAVLLWQRGAEASSTGAVRHALQGALR